MNKKTIWSDLTVGQVDELKDVLKDGSNDWSLILDILGYDINEISTAKLQSIQSEIETSLPQRSKIKLFYKIGGRIYKPQLTLSSLTAGQFIDLQMYTKGEKIEEILSVFMIPCNWYFKPLKYGSYDMKKVQKDIYDYMKFEEANSLSFFFLRQSERIAKVTRDYLQNKLLKAKWNLIKKQQVQAMNG